MNHRLTFKSALTLSSLLTLSITACSSDSGTAVLDDQPNLPPPSSEGGPVGVYNADAVLDVYACEAPYYLELRGIYQGEVSYIPPAGSAIECVWDASLQVRGGYDDPADTSRCNITASYTYQLTEGAEPCVDGSLEGELSDPLAASANRVDWDQPEWPLDLPMRLEPGMPDNAIIPVGTISADTRELRWRFDGLGDTVIVDGTAADGTVTGTLVKR